MAEFEYRVTRVVLGHDVALDKPAGDGWTLHSFSENGYAVWQRETTADSLDTLPPPSGDHETPEAPGADTWGDSDSSPAHQKRRGA